ncbi:uncharacterized protein METZ01_LOCUS233830, partial [marine metagenome]
VIYDDIHVVNINSFDYLVDTKGN